MEDQLSLVQEAQALFRSALRSVQAPALLGTTDPSEWAVEPLETYNSIRVVGMGKAAMAMAGVVEQKIGDLMTTGLVIVPKGYPESYPEELPTPAVTTVLEGGHPLPTEESVQSARRILTQAEGAEEDDLLLVLVSGGGTALSTLPRPGLELPDLKTTYHHLLTAGLQIHQANVVRKHLTQIGGGQLAHAAHPAEVTALMISDVVGDDISVIASGPTAPDPSTFEDAVRVLYRHNLWHDVPTPIRTYVAEGARGNHRETPDSGADCFTNTKNELIGTNQTALGGARGAAEAQGYEIGAVRAGLDGEARRVGERHARTLVDGPSSGPTCYLWGGETTVTVTGEGTGGRNQEVALGGALALADATSQAVLLSGGTDGIDGPTDAAGAWATPETVRKAREAGLDPERHLADNDAYPFFEELGQLLQTGPTHTNVMDVHIGLVDDR